MNETAEKKDTVHQGRNVRFAREFRGLSQEALGDKINKQQSEISKIENQKTVDDEILEQIALALEVSADFLKTFDFENATKTFYINNNVTVNGADNSQDRVNQYQSGEQEINNNFPLEEIEKLTDKFLGLQKELLEENHKLDKENALLKQELQFLKNKK